MTKVNNKKMIRRLALRELKSSMRMNIMVIISVILTCLLFTALTSIGGGLINGIQQETMRQVGFDSMAEFKYLLPEDYEKLKADKETKNVCYRIIVGTAENEQLKNLTVEVNCAGSKQAAETVFCNPEEGRLPESIDEAALSTLILDELELPHELGITVPLKICINGNISEHEFKLSGFWEGDIVAHAQQALVSKSFADKYAPRPSVSYINNPDISNYSGYLNVDLSFASSWNIDKRTAELVMRVYPDINLIPYIGTNWGYAMSRPDPELLAGLMLIALLIFSAGYLLIYNIFHINISANIRGYGLLKTIGTTSRQIKHIVRLRAAVYSAAGIPFGLAAGVLLGQSLIGSITATLNIRSPKNYTVGSEIMFPVCLFAAVFTFATVMISCRKPCRAAGNVSPIEALRYNETDIGTDKTMQKTKSVSPLSVARKNISRSKRKCITVVISLSLSMIILNTLYATIKGLDIDLYLKDYIIGDFIIMNSGRRSDSSEEFYSISPTDIEYLRNIDGINKFDPIYLKQGIISLTEKQQEKLEKLADKYSDSDKNDELKINIKYGVFTDIYGIPDDMLDQLETINGDIDIEKWKSGEYAIVYTEYIKLEDDISITDDDLFDPEDTISFKYEPEKNTLYSVNDSETAKTAQYKVLSVSRLPNILTTQEYTFLNSIILIPESEYFDITNNRNAMKIMMNVDKDKYEEAKQKILALTEKKNSKIKLISKQTYIDEYIDFVMMIKIVGGSLCGILAMIGILNFINTISTGIISRKRELAMMNAVGMTGKQLVGMLMWEGIQYAVYTVVISITAGALISYEVPNLIFKDMDLFSCKMSILPTLIAAPILFILSALIPYIAYRIICRDSITERLREN